MATHAADGWQVASNFARLGNLAYGSMALTGYLELKEEPCSAACSMGSKGHSMPPSNNPYDVQSVGMYIATVQSTDYGLQVLRVAPRRPTKVGPAVERAVAAAASGEKSFHAWVASHSA